MNLIADLGERHKIAKIQIRLIVLEMKDSPWTINSAWIASSKRTYLWI
jgi:hypothetical protein